LTETSAQKIPKPTSDEIRNGTRKLRAAAVVLIVLQVRKLEEERPEQAGERRINAVPQGDNG